MVKAKKTTSKRIAKKKPATFWDRVAKGMKKFFSPAFTKKVR
tara:strand:+ start:579 stop:704 length:126 start_codon:yes stop_codon:yes gene_type:complete